MKIIFLDIDGVLNCKKTTYRHDGFIGIDPYIVAIFNRIIFATGAKIVLSSTWRLHSESREQVRKQVMDFIDCTPSIGRGFRGDEVKEWLFRQGLKSDFMVEKYAILDDDRDFHPDQPLFKTSWEEGLTEEIAEQVITYLNS